MKRLLTLLFSAPLWVTAVPAISETLDCTIQPSLRVDITSSVEGILDEVLVRPGEHVVKGQELARLKDDVERTSLEIARARAKNITAQESAATRHEYYHSRLKRAQELNDRQIIASEQLERAETEYIIAVHDLESAQTDLKFAELDLLRTQALLDLKTVRSPFDGIVVKHYLDVGSFVGDQAMILELAQLDPLKVKTFAPVHLYPTVTATSGATVWPQAPFEKALTAKTSVVETVFDIASGTFGVDLTVANPGYLLPAGLKCKIEFQSTH